MVINARFSGRNISGVERYASEIARRLPGEIHLIKPPGGYQGLRGHLWEQLVLPRLVGRELLWSPANTGPLAITNQMVTIHDTNALEHPEWFSSRFATWYRLIIPLLARRAVQVLTVSQHSKRRLVSLLGISPDRVAVIRPGVDRDQFAPVSLKAAEENRRGFGLDDPYLLFVGSPGRGKNLRRLVQAWGQISSQFPQVELVIAGRAGNSIKSETLLPEGQHVRILGYVPEAGLPSLYSGGLALVMPSLSEGFGLPVLEAMACGLPVIAANSGALPEVVGDSGMLVNALDVDCLASAMSRILSDGDLRHELSACGLERSLQFSWDQTAQAVYQKVLDLEGQNN